MGSSRKALAVGSSVPGSGDRALAASSRSGGQALSSIAGRGDARVGAGSKNPKSPKFQMTFRLSDKRVIRANLLVVIYVATVITGTIVWWVVENHS